MTKRPEDKMGVYSDVYKYEVKPAIKHGKRTVQITVTEGEFTGKSAFVIKMPDSISGYFPDIRRKESLEGNSKKA